MAYDKINKFQNKYKTRAQKESALRKMSNKQIDSLIKSASTIQAKIFYSKYKEEEDGNK